MLLKMCHTCLSLTCYMRIYYICIHMNKHMYILCVSVLDIYIYIYISWDTFGMSKNVILHKDLNSSQDKYMA